MYLGKWLTTAIGTWNMKSDQVFLNHSITRMFSSKVIQYDEL